MKILTTIGATALLVILGSARPAFAQDRPEEEKPAQHEEQAKPVQHEEEAKPAHQEEKAKPAQHQEEAKPAQQEQQAKPEPKEQAKPAKREEQPKQAKQQEQPKPEKQAAAKPAQHAQEGKPAKQQQAKTEKPEQAAKPEAHATKENPSDAKSAQHTQLAKQQAERTSKATAGRQEDSKQVAQSQNNHNASEQRNGAPKRTPAETQRQHSEPALHLSARGEGRIPEERFQSNFGREHVFRIGNPQMEGGYSRFQYGGYWFGFVQPWPVAWYYTDDVYVDYIDGGYYLYNPYYPESRVMISVVL
jgi:hypothetical protein